MNRLAPRTTLAYLSVFAVAALVALACSVWPPISAYRCQPSGAEPRCPNAELCCSDDPTALDLFDLDGPSLPFYEGRGGLATPVFSGPRNGSSDWGMCVKVWIPGNGGFASVELVVPVG